MSAEDTESEEERWLRELSEKIARDHACEKHRAKFNDPSYGPVLNISSEKELAEHIYQTLIDNQTEMFRVAGGNQSGACFAYHQDSNTYLFFCLPENERMRPTAYRPKDGEKRFQEKHKRAKQEHEKIGLGSPEIKHGIHEILPELNLNIEAEKIGQEHRPLIESSEIKPEEAVPDLNTDFNGAVVNNEFLTIFQQRCLEKAEQRHIAIVDGIRQTHQEQITDLQQNQTGLSGFEDLRQRQNEELEEVQHAWKIEKERMTEQFRREQERAEAAERLRQQKELNREARDRARDDDFGHSLD